MHFTRNWYKNVEGFSLEGDTIHSQKRKKGQWDIGRLFQPKWSQNFHLLNQYLQQMRKRLHKKLDALYVVGNLQGSEIVDEVRYNREACRKGV
jgi:hypothetical protein